MKRLNITVTLLLTILMLSPFNAMAWNIAGHMLSGAIAYQVLKQENATRISAIRSILEKNPWYETRWKLQLEKLPQSERDEMLFMLAARWADDIRILDKAESRLPWHYVDFPFKPEGEPASIQTIPPPQENILTAIEVNERILRSGSDPIKRGIALSWLFHLIGDIHPPLHAAALFSREYPKGDQGGTDMCVRIAQGRAALSLHQLWDELLTSSNNTRTLRKMASELRNFPRNALTELATIDPELWAKESFEVATKIAYQNGTLRGTPKVKRRDCREVTDAAVLPNGYAGIARKVADRRMMLAGYRLADLLQRISANSVP